MNWSHYFHWLCVCFAPKKLKMHNINFIAVSLYIPLFLQELKWASMNNLPKVFIACNREDMKMNNSEKQ